MILSLDPENSPISDMIIIAIIKDILVKSIIRSIINYTMILIISIKYIL
jgi:hypothetical protein